MNKKLINIIIISFILLFMLLTFINKNVIVYSINDTINIFMTNVFPFLFITIILNNILLDLNFPFFINKICKNPYLFIFIMSALSGAPINAILISSFLDKKIITEKEASITLSFTTLNNPLFLYNYFNIYFNDNLKTIFMFLTIYISNILIYIIYYKKLKNNNLNIDYKPINFKKSLTNSIEKSIKTLINIFAIITFFKLITDIFFKNINLFSILLRGLIEITQGLNLLSIVESNFYKTLYSLIILSFGGLSIHIQISNILSKYNINYKYFYISRILLIIISIIISFII